MLDLPTLATVWLAKVRGGVSYGVGNAQARTEVLIGGLC